MPLKVIALGKVLCYFDTRAKSTIWLRSGNLFQRFTRCQRLFKSHKLLKPKIIK